ncbi:bifunctional non-homologous end joining protein LigD [Paenibacillus qinlingensis]|uniref:DNA ligase (ATP) n=2 Tax=Paenibacillus qinlingensis TaxID=1837343 RepID=A0ABU1NYM9_9BACL|nr:bifunctional non-homologous end joining protein LigD [Paenibacillus qinlingensis]
MKLHPIAPFEPIRTEIIPTSSDWITQIKWDGVRMLTYFDGHEVRLMNRKQNDRTNQYPELLAIQTYCSATSCIIDGEIIAFDQKKPAFHEVMKRESLRNKKSIDLALSRTPITYMIFDIVMYNDIWLLDRPLLDRQKILEEVIIPNSNVQITQNFADGNKLFEVMKEHGMEGVISKDLRGKYLIGGKDTRWQKKKIFHDLYAVIGGVTLRNGIVNALLLGLFDQGNLHYIGHAGTGKLSNNDWRNLTQLIQSKIISERPFANEPARSNEAIWLKPEHTVKVQFLEWTSNGTMRHPSIQSLVDVQITDCTFQQ